MLQALYPYFIALALMYAFSFKVLSCKLKPSPPNNLCNSVLPLKTFQRKIRTILVITDYLGSTDASNLWKL